MREERSVGRERGNQHWLHESRVGRKGSGGEVQTVDGEAAAHKKGKCHRLNGLLRETAKIPTLHCNLQCGLESSRAFGKLMDTTTYTHSAQSADAATTK